MQPDTGAISLLMLAAALLIGILGISERALSHAIRWSCATPSGNPRIKTSNHPIPHDA